MTDADPLMPGATIGHAFTAATGTFAAVAGDLEETTEIQLVAEIDNTADSLFGQSGLTNTTVLDLTFDDAELVGRPLSMGNLVSQSGISAIFTADTNTYTPFLDMGDDAFPSSHDETTAGTPYQEVLTNFPFGSQILTGLFLNVTLSGPQGGSQTYSRTLVDRIGAAARAGLASASPSINPSGPPILSADNVFTLNVLPGLAIPVAQTSLPAAVTADQAILAGEQNSDPSTDPGVIADVRQATVDLTRLVSASFMAASDKQTQQLADESGLVAYFARPRLILVSTPPQLVNGSLATSFAMSVDLRDDTIRAIAAPGQNSEAVVAFNFARGLAESALESVVLAAGSSGQPAAADQHRERLSSGAGSEHSVWLHRAQQSCPSRHAQRLCERQSRNHGSHSGR